MNKKKILVISQYFYPEQFRINDICKTWVERGYDITVLTGVPNYPYGDFYRGYGYNKKRNENYEGITIKRIPIIPREKNSLIMGLNYLSFVVSGELWKMLNKQEFNLMFIHEVSPMTQSLLAVEIAEKFGIPCYICVMDLWPENFETITGITDPLVIKPLDKVVDYIYKNCIRILTASRSFKRNIENRGIDSEKIHFWPQYAEEFYHIIDAKSDKLIYDREINIIFAENVGTTQGLEILPMVGNKIKEKQLNVRFNIVGDGRYEQELMDEVARANLQEQFYLVDPVPATEIPEMLAGSDFSFVSLQKSDIFSTTIPARLQSSMACGRPILSSADGEVAGTVKETRCGFVEKAGEPNDLFDNLLQAVHLSSQEIDKLGKNSKGYFEKEYEKEKLLSIMDSYLVQE